MNTTEDDLDTALRELADSQPVTPAPVEQLMDRGMRRKRQAGMSAAALGVVAVVTVGLVGASMVGGGPGPNTPAAPLVISAAQATGQTSFQLVATVETKGNTFRQEGAYDPVARKGYLRYTDDYGVTHEQRLIGDERYVISPKSPLNKPTPTRKESPGFALGMATDVHPELTVDPAELLATLRGLGTVTDLGGGRYAFSSPGNAYKSGPFTGTVEVDAGSGYVTEAVYQLTKDRALTLEFSNYGTTVKVERP